MAKLPHLFQPGRFGRFDIKNRIKYGACCVSNYNTRDGFITEREIARMRVIARTGCGIITNQGAYPDPLGEGKAYFRQLAIFDDKFLPQFERIAADIKAQGAMPIQQILHAGRYGGIDLGYCIQPSDVPQTLPHFRPPKVMTKEEIRDCVRQHAEAANRAIRAGFDGTEVTSFMGYLLANFNSRFTNQRTDEYGGSIENRGRFMRELIDGIKQATPDNPLIVRLNGAELMDHWGGNTEDECFELMQQAVDVGVDMISVTVGWQEAPESSIGRDIPPGYWNYLSARAKKMFPSTLVTFGNRLLRLLGGLPAAARRPRPDTQGSRRPTRRGSSLHRLAELPVAALPRPALHMHDEPGARSRGRAGVSSDAGYREEESDGDRRRARRHGVRDHRGQAWPRRDRFRQGRPHRRQPLCLRDE
jgi:2,4-dienoyl-CoA reductase (NADPH2)